jgi:hypothetical protein
LAIPKINFKTVMDLLMPALLSITGFFSWIMLVNSLRIPFYMSYWRTIYLIYVDRFVDPIIWLLFCELAVLLCAITNRSRSVTFLASILSLVCGIVIGNLAVLGAAAQEFLTAGSLLTLVGCVLAGFVATRAMSSTGRRHFAIVTLLTLSLLVLPAELGSLLYYVLSAFQPGVTMGKGWELLEMQLWYTASPLTPFLYAAFLFSWIWVPLLLRVFPSLKPAIQGNRLSGNVSSKKNSTWLWLVASCILISAFLGWFPYFHDASYPLVGTDIYWHYVRPAQTALLSGTTIGQWTASAAKAEHPLSVVLVTLVSNFTGLTPESLLRFAYAFLAIAFSGSIFLLVKFASGNRVLASMSALVAAFSPTTTIGIYTGIIANWLALIAWVLSLIPLAIEKVQSFSHRVFLTVGLAVGSIVVLFLHPWTWISFVVGFIAYFLIRLAHRSKINFHDVVLIVVAVLINGIAVGVSFFHFSSTEGWTTAGGALTLIQTSIKSGYLGVGSWEILVYFSQIWSPFLNPVFLFLSVLGVFVIAGRSDRLEPIMLAWIAASSLTAMVAAPLWYTPSAPGTLLWRAVFITPFQMPAAIGMLTVSNALNRRLGQSHAAKIAAAALLMVLFLAIFTGALRALFPLLTDPHSLSNTPP